MRKQERKPQDQQKADCCLANYCLKSSQKLYHSNFHSSIRLVKCWCRNPLQSLSLWLLAELSKSFFHTVMAVPALQHLACFSRLWVDAPALAFQSIPPAALRHNVLLSLWDLQRSCLIWVHRQNSFHSNASAWIGQSHYS